VDAEAIAEATALVEATAQTRQALTSSVTASVVAQVEAFDGWYDSRAIGVLSKRLSAVTGSGQRQTGALTSSYVARLLRILLGRTPTTVGRVSVVDLRGVPLDSVFGRLSDEYRWLRSDGVSVDGVQAPALIPQEAIDRVIARAEAIVDQSLTLALVHQWAAATEAAPGTITGYRRVIHPELPTEASLRDGKAPPPVCGLCVAASTRVYYRGDLMPVHANCRCLPSAITGSTAAPATSAPSSTTPTSAGSTPTLAGRRRPRR
jgi:hypothetical protein